MMDFKLNCFLLTTVITIVLCEDTVTQSPVQNENLNTVDNSTTVQTNIANDVNESEYKLPTVQTNIANDVNESEYKLPTVQTNIANDVNEFGYKLLLTMMQQDIDENIIISPTSIAGLLAMTLLGTVGKTFSELAGALGFSQDVIKNRKNHEQFGELLLQLNSNDSSSKTLYADAMFVDAEAKLRSLFQEYLGRVYRGDVVNVDFKHQGVVVKDLINEWVSSHTQGKLDNFLLKPLPEVTKVVLLSTLYFRGQWMHPFLPEYTAKLTFRKPANEVTADQMLNMGSFNYILSEEYGLQMIALPYNDSITNMYVMKPIFPDNLSLLDLMNRLDYVKIDQLINKMEERKSVIRFPKMDLERKVKLERSLKALGVQSLFTPGEANFALMVDSPVSNNTELGEDIITKMNTKEDDAGKALNELLNGLPNPGIHVDSVLHDVKLTINEYGTEAAAATAGVLARTARLFYADSPFYMFIRNEQTKLITFSAVIFDPTA